MFLQYITSNYVMLIELIGLWILLIISVHIPRKMIHFTRAAMSLILFCSIIIHVEQNLSNSETLSMFRPILTFVNYFLQPFILLLVIQIAAPFNKKRSLLLLIPELLSIPIYCLSQQFKLVCWFTEDNHYQGGPLASLPYFIFLFYLVVFVVQCFIRFKTHNTNDKAAIIIIILLSISGVFLYVTTKYSNDYSAIFTSALLMYYLFLYIQMAKNDPLTNLMNRKCYYRDIKLLGSKITAVASIDMNDLKFINDSLGHDAGDRALVTVSNCLRNTETSKRLLYRVGGDEFMILYIDKTEPEVLSDIESMRKNLTDTKYTCAFGYAMSVVNQTIADTIKISDKAMYDNKSAMKMEILSKGGQLHRRHDDP